MRLALRMLRRDWRSGELRVLLLALIVAVASVSSVNFFTSRIHLALSSQASDLLGGDLALLSSDPTSAERKAQATALELQLAETLEFPTMVVAGDGSQLVALKAVSSNYPLRGQYRIATQLFAADREVAGGPAPGTVWAAAQLLTALAIDVGDQISVGSARFRVAALLVTEPDSSGGMMFSVAPRLLMSAADLPATGLIQPASRIRYTLLLAGAPKQIEALRGQWQDALLPGESLRDVRDSRPEVRTALERGESFLGLAALVSVLLAAAAVAMAARHFVSRHLDSCAVMRCLGAEQEFINRLYLQQMVLLGLIASGIGVALGYVAQWGLAALLGPLVGVALPPPTATPILYGLLTGLVTLLGFALPPILQLKNVSTLRVLRRDLGGVQGNTLLAYGVGGGAFLLLAIMQAQSLTLALAVVAGVAALLLVLTLLAWGVLRLLRLVRSKGGSAWRLGLVNLARRGDHTLIQMIGFSIGLMALLLLAVVRTDLLDAWQGRLPEDAPNRFLINIQSEQLPALQQFFATQGLTTPALYPMVRARLTEINGKPVMVDEFEDQRAKQLLSREFNLSSALQMQSDNKIVAGRWWSVADVDKPELSLEEGIAKELGLKLGDTLTYSVAGQQFTAPITSLRSVEWDSFQPNFFVVTPPGLLKGYPVSYITAFYLPTAQHELLNQLVRQFPNITVIDVAAVLNQVRAIITRVTQAVEYVFIFTLFAGLVVMYAAIHATLDERIQEAAIMRTLGARRGQLLGTIIVEYVGLGLLSGLVAALSAGAVGMVVAQRFFDLGYVPGPTLWLTGMVVGAIGIGMAGTLGLRFVINQPPLQTLRS
ncbi:MAG: FtsX-like permease family protein [Pseudomonadota bacterium]|nr:FtsX-like permease family protein [Pseudomonadota bacterium]